MTEEKVDKIVMLDKTKADIFYDRNEKNELIPKLVYVEELERHIEILPLTIGEWRDVRRKLLTGDASFVEAIVCEKIVTPKFTMKDMAIMKPWVGEKLWDLILTQSGLEPTKKKDDIKNSLQKPNEETKMET